MIRISISPEDLAKINQFAQGNNGWANLNLSKRREVSKKGQTHSVTLNTWKPKQGVQSFEGVPEFQQQSEHLNSINPVKRYIRNEADEF